MHVNSPVLPGFLYKNVYNQVIVYFHKIISVNLYNAII